MPFTLQSKFRLLKSPEESQLLNTTSLTREQVAYYCYQFSDNMSYFETAELSYFSWNSVCVRSQIMICEFLVYCECDPDALDRVGDLLYSMIPPKLRLWLKGSADHFIESLLYLHRKGSTLKGFQKVIGWLDNCRGGLVFSNIAAGANPVTHVLLKELENDCNSKQSSRRLTENFERTSSGKLNVHISREKLHSRGLAHLLFLAKYQCFYFLSQPISIETVAAFLQSILNTSVSFEKLTDSIDGASVFANCYLQPVILECDSIPIELIKMIYSAAFCLGQSNASLEEEVAIPRLSALTRWFTPWFDLDFSHSGTWTSKPGFFRSGKEFVSLFKTSLAQTLKSWNLDERDSPVPCYEIGKFMSTIINLFSTTELDYDMIDLILRNNISKLVDPSIFPILLFCIQSEIRTIFKVSILEVPVPKEWVKNPDNQKIFSGEDKAVYPRWRQQALLNLLGSEKNEAADLLIGLMKDPIATEIDFVLELSKRKSKPGILPEIFSYLDKIFKFKPDKTWLQSELFRIIEKAIAGISDKREKEIAKFASTWKCETFEEYMEIVSLF
jgi:hypothetical protein